MSLLYGSDRRAILHPEADRKPVCAYSSRIRVMIEMISPPLSRSWLSRSESSGGPSREKDCIPCADSLGGTDP